MIYYITGYSIVWFHGVNLLRQDKHRAGQSGLGSIVRLSNRHDIIVEI